MTELELAKGSLKKSAKKSNLILKAKLIDQDPFKVKNSVGAGFRGASISISEKSLNSMNEVRAYQTLLWQQNPIQLLSQFNLRTLTFDQPSEEAVDEFRNLKPGPYTFRNPILKGKDELDNIDVGDGFSHSSTTSVNIIDVNNSFL